MSTNLLTMLTQDLHEMRSCVWYPSFNKWCFGAFRCWIYWKMLASPCLIVSLQTMQAFLGDLDVNLYIQTSFFQTHQRLQHPCRTGVFGCNIDRVFMYLGLGLVCIYHYHHPWSCDKWHKNMLIIILFHQDNKKKSEWPTKHAYAHLKPTPSVLNYRSFLVFMPQIWLDL